MTESRHTANYRITTEPGGRGVSFYCASSGMLVCRVQPVNAESDEAAVKIAWDTEGRERFDKCRQCGRWVSTVMYNADVLACVDCAPWEEKPKFCPACGLKLKKQHLLCPKCRTRLMYGGDEDSD